MYKTALLFIKIIIILILFTIILPSFIDWILNVFIIENNGINVPKGNSTFVSSSKLEKFKGVQQNLLLLFKYYLY